jgi:hypothetical protein
MSTLPDPYQLTGDQQAQLANLAEQLGQPRSQVLDAALAVYGSGTQTSTRGEHESFYDAASRLGLLGCVDGGPPDLSTNPKYLEGFGGNGD